MFFMHIVINIWKAIIEIYQRRIITLFIFKTLTLEPCEKCIEGFQNHIIATSGKPSLESVCITLLHLKSKVNLSQLYNPHPKLHSDCGRNRHGGSLPCISIVIMNPDRRASPPRRRTCDTKEKKCQGQALSKVSPCVFPASHLTIQEPDAMQPIFYIYDIVLTIMHHRNGKCMNGKH